MKVFVIDVGVCNGCYSCQIACKDEHVGNDWTPIAKPQPDTGQFWLHLNEHIRGTVPKVKMHYRARTSACTATRRPACRPAPSRAPSTSATTAWSSSTPRSAPAAQAAWTPARTTSSTSTRASTWRRSAPAAPTCWTAAGRYPRCADSCPTEAIKFGEESEFKDLIAKAEVLKPEPEAKPRVYYLNMPKKFVAGTVYDPVEKEVVIGATCTLKGPKAGKQLPSPPTTSATSGSTAWPTAPIT